MDIFDIAFIYKCKTEYNHIFFFFDNAEYNRIDN
jgi:hypothetical protein